MAAPKAPVHGAKGAKKEHALDEAIFAAEVKSHLVHEAVRAEANARRSGTAADEEPRMVSAAARSRGARGHRPRTRRHDPRAQFEGGGHAFAKVPRSFEQKVNRSCQSSPSVLLG